MLAPTRLGTCDAVTLFTFTMSKNTHVAELIGLEPIPFRARAVEATGFEPVTPCVQGRCSGHLSYAPTCLHGTSRTALPAEL